MGPDAFDYDLPAAAIAQVPAEPRDAARLLVSLEAGGAAAHLQVADLAELLGPGDLLVLNDTRVLPARLRLRRATGGAVEVLLLEPDDEPRTWTALVRPGRRLPPGTRVEGPGLAVVIGERIDGGRRRVEVQGSIAEHGVVPLPPYIHATLMDPERYQTVYARRSGSVAAPTAGLHLTSALLDRCRAAGAEIARVDLAVGLDTFKPLAVDDLDAHVMHTERYSVPAATMEACGRAQRVIAVGTSTVRALESAARGDLEGRTDLFIRHPFEFRVVDVLLTNFHVPRSTLLVLLDAFIGARWRDLYARALDDGYRFLSFGDAMLVGRRPAERIVGRRPAEQ
ncbi:MAG: tRNA preQ1(34) S-adenosylmethionine ribosyltransferase-isomerase QueA [Actinobacteria bacterium]|nr:MAG: tRNA preQ1(34) S-adenosylmethionine ribosyltransferase-isomerase QueA [Actinomycetota bacterium]